jgi:hypothetical protein
VDRLTERPEELVMRLTQPFVPIEVEIRARRRTEPLRFRVRTLLIAIAVVGVVICLFLPLSAADRRLMATYEWLGNTDPERGVTKAQVIREIGPPASWDIPASPNLAASYTWVASLRNSRASTRIPVESELRSEE